MEADKQGRTRRVVNPSVTKKTAVISVTALLIVILILFDIDIEPKFSLPRDVETLDLEQETRFQSCVDERDRFIHAETFGTIDNPDVQREILATEKDKAVRECRGLYPEYRVTSSEPFHFNIIDLKFRY